MSKKRIAVIFDEDIYNQRGMFNAIRNRIKHLHNIADFDIDVYVIGCYEPWYIRLLRNTKKVEKLKSIQFDGITYNTLWYNFTLLDYLLEVKLHIAPIFTNLFYRKLIRKIKGYDLISAHSINCGRLASQVAKRENIPFCVTWHGTDIHTTPFVSDSKFNLIRAILSSASYNFFVSDQLKSVGSTIAPEMKSIVLYNGRNRLFVKYQPEERNKVREKYSIDNKTKVVAFVGNLLEVKNPHLLAPIFSSVEHKYSGSVTFWIIGSGKLSYQVEKLCEEYQVKCIMWGAQPVDKMPDFFNCIDILVLPSRNEGLPLVTVEALACGANVVGSAVGGIGEAIGFDNVFPHGENFVDAISDRIVQMLNSNISQSLTGQFEWENTARKELEIYTRLFLQNEK